MALPSYDNFKFINALICVSRRRDKLIIESEVQFDVNRLNQKTLQR